MRTDTGFSASGTLPSAMRSARPSTRAVLPTPGSPTRIGLFFSPTGENIHHLADFRVASEHRVNLAVSGFGGDVESEFVQRVLQRRVEPIRIQFAARRTPHKFHVPAMGLRQRRFLLRWRTFVGLGIQQGAQRSS